MKIYLAGMETRSGSIVHVETVGARTTMAEAHKALLVLDGVKNVPALAKFENAGRMQYGFERAQHKWAAQSKNKQATKTFYTITEMELEGE